MAVVRVGIITSSDSCSIGEREDLSGSVLRELVEASGWTAVGYRLCADDHDALVAAIIELADVENADVVFTTGGTGFGPRDVTPEATMAACDRMAPGLTEYIRAESAKITVRAILSRATAGLRGRTLVVNMPGSPKAVREAFGFIAGQVEHAVEMAAGGGHD
jgi:molybdopterin adenylyltransferase